MTNVNIRIKYAPDTIDVSGRVMSRLDIWRKSVEGIGRFSFKLGNETGQWNGQFAADDPVEIKINNVVFMRGYLDVAKPVAKDELSIFQREMLLSGRDYGQDLQNLINEKIYKYQPADDIIADMLSSAGSEITFTSPSTAPKIQFTEGVPHFLQEGIRRILEKLIMTVTWITIKFGKCSV